MLLLYCMTEAKPDAALPPHGVRQAVVEVMQHSRLACYFSRYEQFKGGTAEELKQDALDFHWTIDHIFQQQTVVPFRFPTLLSDSAALDGFLREHASAYLADLERLRDQVQMEVRLTMLPEPPVAGTGTAYLKAKYDAAQKVVELERLMKSAVRAEWKHRANRYFALIPRGVITEFRDKLADLGQAPLRVSGPWPPSEFVNCYPDLPTK